MKGLPASTHFNQRIPKQRFYDKIKPTPSLERLFVQEIETIRWTHKLAADTLNVNPGSAVAEIQVLEIALKEQRISKQVIEFLDREIPYHLVFVIRFQEHAQVWIGYKEQSKNRDGKFKVDSYYTTPWTSYTDLSLKIMGLDLDAIYTNFLMQVAGERLQLHEGASLRDAVVKSKEREKLEARIQRLEKQITNEKQFNRQVELLSHLRKAQAELAAGVEQKED